MAEYSTFKYGDGTKYGASTPTEGGIIQLAIDVDWDGDGNLDGTNEAGYVSGFPEILRGVEHYLEAGGNGFSDIGPDSCIIYFHNKDRRYDPRNTGSALYPNVVPGRLISVRVKELDTSNVYNLFAGKIDDIVPLNAPGGGTVRLECRGYSQQLDDYQLTSAATAINTNIKGALAKVLADAEYPGAIDLDTDAQPVHAFGVKNRNALQTAHDIAHSALGIFFTASDGTAKYYARNHSYGAATSLNSTQCLNTPTVTQPWDGVYNRIEVYANRTAKEQPSVLYFLPSPVTVAQSTDVHVYPDYEDAGDLVVSAYESNADQDGGGTDTTATTTITASLGRSNGDVLVRNNSAAGYLTKLEIRGRPWRQIAELHTSSDATSQAKYGKRVFLLDKEFLQDQNYASSFAGTLKDFLKDDREGLIVQLENRPTLQFGFDLFDAVEFTSTALDISATTYYVVGLKHEAAGDKSQGVITTLFLQKIVTDSTSITAAPVEENNQQAPLSYGNPAGDPETIDAVSDDPDSGLDGGRVDNIFYADTSVLNGALGTIDGDGYVKWNQVWVDQGSLITEGDSEVVLSGAGDLGTYVGTIYAEINNQSGGDAYLEVTVTYTLRDASDNVLVQHSYYSSSTISNGDRAGVSGPVIAPKTYTGTAVDHIVVAVSCNQTLSNSYRGAARLLLSRYTRSDAQGGRWES